MPYKGERPLLRRMVISSPNEIFNYLRMSPFTRSGVKPKNESSILLLSLIIYVTKAITRTNHEPDAD
jgi:hypothetical protein